MASTSDARHAARSNRIFCPRDWPLAVKIAALCISIAAMLAIGLTALGYVRASAGLRQQAESALGADALTVTTSIDRWHRERWAALQMLASLPAVQEVARQGDQASPDARQVAASALASLDGTASEL